MEPNVKLQYFEPGPYDPDTVPLHMLSDCYNAIQSHNPWLASRLIDYAHYAEIDLDAHIPAPYEVRLQYSIL